jgi:DNA (cytosine-5)-methyltransferase 1
MNYYNEFDKFAAGWLRELISEGLIPDGHVDERDIRDVKPSDLDGYTQVHFFAGIGGWSRALDLAGWSSEVPVWTGSCPCQPLSVAGLGKGHEDERHLWPEFARLICECRPGTILGEQVASKDGREWLAGIRADLEKMGYAVGAADLCAAGVGAPHIRQRLFWCGRLENSSGSRPGDNQRPIGGQGRQPVGPRSKGLRQGYGAACPDGFGADGSSGRLGDTPLNRRREEPKDDGRRDAGSGEKERPERPGDFRGACWAVEPIDWTRTTWHPCADGKWRRVPGGVADTYRPQDDATEKTDGRGEPQSDNRDEIRVEHRASGKDGERVEDSSRIRRGRWSDGVPGRQDGALQTEGPCGVGERVAESEPQLDGAGEPRTAGWREPSDSGDEYQNESDRSKAQSLFQSISDGLPADLGDSGYQSVIEAMNCFPLSGAIPGRVGLLKGAGNAIVPQVAAEFIKAYMEVSCQR